jgi:hypothetical protein
MLPDIKTAAAIALLTPLMFAVPSAKAADAVWLSCVSNDSEKSAEKFQQIFKVDTGQRRIFNYENDALLEIGYNTRFTPDTVAFSYSVAPNSSVVTRISINRRSLSMTKVTMGPKEYFYCEGVCSLMKPIDQPPPQF